MSNRKRRQLDSIIAALQTRYGPQVVRKAGELKTTKPPALSSGFPTLDQCTGCQGIPLGHITLLSGRITSGKLTLAYKTLANAKSAAILDFNQHSDPDYLARCGIDLRELVVVRPAADKEAVNLLVDIVRSRQAQLILIDSITNLLVADRAVTSHLYRALDILPQTLRRAKCGLLLIDEADPPWQRWLNLDRSHVVRRQAALHIEMRREQWLYQAGLLVGYRATAHVHKSHWRHDKPQTPIAIHFNGTVKAQATW